MKVFVSWSKPQSRVVAKEFADFLPRVIQECSDPFLSTDTTKGDAWFTRITEALENSKVGVVFVTRENQNEPWLNFESGALLTKLTGQRLCPVLVGLTKADYAGPLKNLQLTEFDDVNDMKRLFADINNECENKLSDAVLDDAFKVNWLGFKERVDVAIGQLPNQFEMVALRPLDSKVDEALELLRDLSRAASVRSVSYDRRDPDRAWNFITTKQIQGVPDAELNLELLRNIEKLDEDLRGSKVVLPEGGLATIGELLVSDDEVLAMVIGSRGQSFGIRLATARPLPDPYLRTSVNIRDFRMEDDTREKREDEARSLLLGAQVTTKGDPGVVGRVSDVRLRGRDLVATIRDDRGEDHRVAISELVVIPGS